MIYSSSWANRCWSISPCRFVRIAVGSGDIAEATAVSPSEVLVNGKTVGETTLIVWESGGGRQFFNVTVRASATAANDNMRGYGAS